MKHADFVPKYLKGQGVEIGAFKTPIPGIKPIYVDKFESFADEPCLVDFLGDAVSLPFEDNSLDYVVNSHVLEHVSNPVKALLEWQRVLKPGGIVYAVIPDRRYTFDHARELTAAQHMIEDFRNDTTDADATHVKDFIYGIDWSHTHPDIAKDDLPGHQKVHYDYYINEAAKGGDINIHFHVFEPHSFKDFVDTCTAESDIALQFDILEIEERFPEPEANGFLIVLKKRGEVGFLGKLIAKLKKISNPQYPVKKSAKRVSSV